MQKIWKCQGIRGWKQILRKMEKSLNLQQMQKNLKNQVQDPILQRMSKYQENPLGARKK